MSDVALLRAYEPVVRFTQGELFYPSAVDEYVQRCPTRHAPSGSGDRDGGARYC